MGPLACPSRRASSVSSLSDYAANDVIAHRLAHRLALRILIAHRPVIRHDRRGESACLVLRCFSCPHAVI